MLGSLLGLLMALPRVYYAMARDGVFFKTVAAVHPRFGTPARAIAIQAGIASLYVALGTFNQIIAYFVFVTVLFVGLTVAGLFLHPAPRACCRVWHVGLSIHAGAVSRPGPLFSSFCSPATVRCGRPSASGSSPSACPSIRSRFVARSPLNLWDLMTWIKTVPLTEGDEKLRRAVEDQRALYPEEYATPVHPTPDGTSGIVASHSLIPDALHHAFARSAH